MLIVYSRASDGNVIVQWTPVGRMYSGSGGKYGNMLTVEIIYE